MANQEELKTLYNEFQNCPNPLDKNIFLHSVYQKSPETCLDLMRAYVSEMLPIIYTPTVAEAVKHFRDRFRHPQALYLSYKNKGNLSKILQEHQNKPIKVIVVTDGERILGLGDQGAPGVEIVAAKLMLYMLFTDIKPEATLPIVLDVGTNNKELLAMDNYCGWQHQRINSEEYDAFIDEFVQAVKSTWPDVLLQWEDFGKNNARRLLKKYQHQICSFNDDIQGTAVITLATILSAIQITQTKLSDQRIVIFGAGSSGVGIASLLTYAMQARDNVSEEQARKQIWILNSRGLLTPLSQNLQDDQKLFMRSEQEISDWPQDQNGNIDLAIVINKVKPTVLIGCSGQGGKFTREIIQKMAEHTSRPIILPISNPTANSEAIPQDLIDWTEGRALIATGSPFPSAKYQDREIAIAQCNNAFSFPGIGLGILKSDHTVVSNEMFYQAALTIAGESPAMLGTSETLLPSIQEAEKIARNIANKLTEMA